MNEPPPRIERYEIAKGIGLLLVPHMFFAAACFVLLIAGPFSEANSYGLLAATLFIGFFQFLYVIPAVIVAWRRKRTGIMKGMLICAGITLLLNGTCTLLFRFNSW